MICLLYLLFLTRIKSDVTKRPRGKRLGRANPGRLPTVPPRASSWIDLSASSSLATKATDINGWHTCQHPKNDLFGIDKGTGPTTPASLLVSKSISLILINELERERCASATHGTWGWVPSLTYFFFWDNPSLTYLLNNLPYGPISWLSLPFFRYAPSPLGRNISSISWASAF